MDHIISHLLCHLQQGLVVTLPFGPPLCGFLLQLLDLLGHLEIIQTVNGKQGNQ